MWRHLFEHSEASMQTLSTPPAEMVVDTLARSMVTKAVTTLFHTGHPHKHVMPEIISLKILI